ncbi:MAG TPA: hypothetical protein VK599_06135 [Streptosporangiaceae bacterium]|jgi:hypothetical protein|nr:hypothetical protein [Streptosporangiaceae bacterium]
MMDTDDTSRAVLAALRHAVDDAAPGGRPDAVLPQIMTTARSRRRRRRLAGSAAGAGLAASAALALVLAAPGAGPATSVNLAAWSVHADSDGIVTVKMRSFTNTAQLQRVLAEDKIPALVLSSIRPCSAAIAESQNQLVNDQPDAVPTASQPIAVPAAHGTDWTMAVDPALLPSGWELVISSGVYAPGHPSQDSPIQATPGYPGPGQSGLVEIGVVKKAAYPDCH